MSKGPPVKNTNRSIVEQAISVIANDVSKEKSNLVQIFRKVASHPIKMVAAFFTAPFLMIRVAWKVENPIRRIIAVVGLIVAFLSAYLAATFLGTVAGAVFIASQVGFLVGFGFLLGTAISVILSVTFSIFVFNTVSLVFLKMSSQDVVDYLQDISE
jgi:hypothetical protein